MQVSGSSKKINKLISVHSAFNGGTAVSLLKLLKAKYFF